MANLVVGITEATAQQRDAISRYLGSLGGYWHWMPDLWLVNTTGNTEPSEVRDFIHREYPSLVCIVLKVHIPVGDNNWASVFPGGQSSKWANWLNKFWKRGT